MSASMGRFSRLTWLAATATMLATAACGRGDPRFGGLAVSAAAPRATLSGRTSPSAGPALELSPGCPGFVDDETPEHALKVVDGGPYVVAASSPAGPLVLAVLGEGEVRCDSDGGGGHAPHVTIERPGDYLVFVGALARPEELPYELSIAPGPTGVTVTPSAGAETQVSVTITSTPPGASVRTPEGEALGTTPAMFVVSARPDEEGTERRFILDLAGYRSAEVAGRLVGGSVVLHAALEPIAMTPTPIDATPSTVATSHAGELVVSTRDPARPIRDFTTVEQALEIERDCTIGSVSVTLDIEHSYVADLRVVLRAPSGSEVVLHNHQGGAARSLATTIDWNARRGALRALAGQNARGRWTLIVHDDVRADSGVLRGFSLRIACGTPPPPTRTRGTATLRPPTRPPPPPLISPWTPSPPPVRPAPPILRSVPPRLPPPRSNRRESGTASDGLVNPWF